MEGFLEEVNHFIGARQAKMVRTIGRGVEKGNLEKRDGVNGDTG